MSREIIYKAWDNVMRIMLEVTDISFVKETIKYINPKDKNCKKEISFRTIELMQFTGLLDENKKMIFEGDIVTYNGFVVLGIVRYGKYKRQQFMNGDQPHENIGFYIDGIPSYSKSGVSNTHVYSLIQHNGVIIKGNIWETPELLETDCVRDE